MIILTGSNLGERQRELNTKVKEAAAQSVNFDEIKHKYEESDVDKLFKIDLASKYRNIDYIIEVLKSGDSLYISRALKCDWIYGESFSHIINVDYLQKKVIPFMSYKMRKKLLTAISIHVRNESRAADFFKYCMDVKYQHIALKFLNFTNEAHKLEALKDKSTCNLLIFAYDSECPKNFIGLSFTLAEAFVQVFHESRRMQLFRELSYLYTVSEVKYLDMFEKYVEISPYSPCLGLRVSKSIMKQHKDRVLKMPSLYVRILSKAAVVKYSTAEDAKIYATALLPDNVDSFWHQNFCSTYKFILDKITVGKFEFVKQIFTAKYPNQEFETSTNFYHLQCYELMTSEEKETWALQQIASGNEILGVGNDYLWYKFVNFEKALEEIKKLVLVTTDSTARADMMLILIDSAKTQRDVEKLLKHYYEKHVNELKHIKENFLDRVMQNFNVFEFDEECWTAFNIMFHNLTVYNLTDFISKSEYRIVALVYHIINQKEVPEAIRNEINSHMQLYVLKMNTDKLSEEQREMVFEYLFKFYMDEIKKFENVPYEDEVKYSLRKYIHFTLDILTQYDKTKEDVPELVHKFMKLDWDEFKFHKLIQEKKKEITNDDLYRDLKKDAKLLIEHLPVVKTNIDGSYNYNITAVLKKLKTYFSNDIAKEYLKFFCSLLANDQLWHKVTQAAAHGIFQLGEQQFKVDFMAKYAPKSAKIKHGQIDEKLLRIQQAICAHACYSRPPVPLRSILMYTRGDYVQYCLPMFNSFLANMPLPLCIQFVGEILNAPVSLQKHGIRLAFECFDTESLNKLVLQAWKKTKNVSLRRVIYKSILHKTYHDKSGQDLLFETLKKLTLTLKPDDDEEVFRMLISNPLPSHQPNPLFPQCIEMAWQVVSQFPPKPINLLRMNRIVTIMSNKIDILRQEFVHDIVESFIATVNALEVEWAMVLRDDETSLINAKWNLTATYITNVKSNDDLGKIMAITKLILTTCLTDTDNRSKKKILQKKCFKFIHELEDKSYYQDYHRYENINKIMQLVLETLEEKFPIEKIYMKVWEIRLGIVTRKVIAESKIKYANQGQIEKDAVKEIANNFANEIGILMKEFIEKEMFFGTFSSDIQSKIMSKAQIVNNEMNTLVQNPDMIAFVCFGLMSFELTEIYILVLNLLPSVCRRDYEEEFNAVMKKIAKMENKELRCNVYRKFPDFDGIGYI